MKLAALWVYLATLSVAVIFAAPARPSSSKTALVICDVFGDRYCGQALRVAWCESRFSTRATNGQYVNLFQMGYWERKRYGWHVAGSPARLAAQAAYRYFVATGKTWRPWSCKP